MKFAGPQIINKFMCYKCSLNNFIIGLYLQKSSEGYMKLYEMGMEPGRKPFLDQLFSFLEEKGTPISIMPVISKQPLDLYRLYQCVQEKGGMTEV